MRIDGLRRLGADARVLAFERPTSVRQTDVGPYERLGTIEHGHYGQRVVRLLAALPRVRAAARESDAVYCFGLDLLLLARLACLGLTAPPQIVYEVGDIRPTFVGDGPVAWIARAIERWGLRRVARLVVTSSAYARSYFLPLQRLGDTPHQVIENKVDPEVLPETPRPPADAWDGTIRIVYYGWMCCADSWTTLKRIAERGGDRVRVEMHGVLFADLAGIEPEIESIPNITYHGPFRNPDDMPKLFANVDLAWIAHHDLLANVLWARATRFFSAGHFFVPMIAQQGTEDGAVVAARDFGPVVDLADPEAAADRVLAISGDEMARWRKAVADAPRTLFAYRDEHRELLDALEHAADGSAPDRPRRSPA